MANRIFCVEVGGTFTDWVLVENGRVTKTGKVLSTPEEPAAAVMNALRGGVEDVAGLSSVIHGSTVATNAVLERKGAVMGLMTTRGFRDVLQIQRQSKSRLFDLFYRQPEPLVPRDRILEVSERISPRGEVWRPLELEDLAERLEKLVAEGTESIAVCLLHSYANPMHELALSRYLEKRYPHLYVTLSSEVLPRFREYERMSTCTISAYVKPRVDRYLGELESSLSEAGFEGHLAIVQANGGSIPASEARRHAAKMILSGPAAGVIGAIASARASGFKDLLTIDMGGTSTDVCLVTGGRTEISTEYKIGGLPLGIPMIDIVTVGAGGGSIARIDSGGALRVGPESSGADPGPACYGRGGRDFTVTDANLFLGLLDPETFYGGRMRLSVEATSEALDPLIERLGSTREQVASGVVRLANATMAQAMRLVSVERGHDPRDYTIVAYGGAGPLHAVALAEELSVRSVLVPRNPGLLSAYGLMLADVRQDYLRSHIVALRELESRRFQDLFEELAKRAREEFARYGLRWEDVEVSGSIDMRYEGQAYELTIELDPSLVRELSRPELIARFKEMHRFRYGYAPSGNEVEIVNFRLTARHPSGSRPFDEQTGAPPSKVRITERNILLGGNDVLCRFYERLSLPPGYSLLGPSVIEEPTSTTYVPTGWKARVDDAQNLVLTPEGETSTGP